MPCECMKIRIGVIVPCEDIKNRIEVIVPYMQPGLSCSQPLPIWCMSPTFKFKYRSQFCDFNFIFSLDTS
uniref:Uncharacterized protein n=1 Tax=Solanum lycopersicum TaxID=4081 RepID=K4DGJ4_SOLLC